MGLFNREARLQRRADRKRRRADRKRGRATELDRKADALSPVQEEATIIATDREGRQVKQDVMMSKASSAIRNARLIRLEGRVDELDEENQLLKLEIEDLESQLDDVMDNMEFKQRSGQLFSKGALGAANALLTFINLNDQVMNRGALLASETLDALVDLDQLDAQQKDWARIGRVLLKAIAYFDPKAGLMSILESEKKP